MKNVVGPDSALGVSTPPCRRGDVRLSFLLHYGVKWHTPPLYLLSEPSTRAYFLPLELQLGIFFSSGYIAGEDTPHSSLSYHFSESKLCGSWPMPLYMADLRVFFWINAQVGNSHACVTVGEDQRAGSLNKQFIVVLPLLISTGKTSHKRPFGAVLILAL